MSLTYTIYSDILAMEKEQVQNVTITIFKILIKMMNINTTVSHNKKCVA